MYVLCKFIFFFILIVVSVAFSTLLERKVLGLVGLRPSPQKVFFFGVFQPITDAVKLMNKQLFLLNFFSTLFFYVSSFLVLFLALFCWSLSSTFSPLTSQCYPLIVVMLLLSFNSLISVFCGWSSFSKFSLLGCLRSVSQLISYESVLYLSFFFFFFFWGSVELNCVGYFDFYFLLLFPLFFVWFPSVFAELNRTPFDFSEGESELVSGFNTEFGAQSFTFLFLSEYMLLIFFSLLSCLFFFEFFFLFMLVFFFMWVRSVFPRFRFDKLMFLCWKFYLPFLTFFFIMSVCFVL